MHQRRRRLAVVDVEGAAVVEHHAEVMDLPPNVWFRGNQSSSTGGLSVSVNTGIDCLICCWLAQACAVLITPLGSLGWSRW